MENQNNALGLLQTAYKVIDDKFGIDTVVLDISAISVMADYFIITSGANSNQLKAIADSVEESLYKEGVILNHSEGYNSDSWILLDFSSIIVHIFSKESREFYDLERVWGDARTVSVTLSK